MNMNFGMCQPFGYGDRYGYNSGNACLGGFLRGQCFLGRTFNSADGMHNVVTARTRCFRKAGMDYINDHVYADNFWGNGDGMLYGMEYNASPYSTPWNSSMNNAWSNLGAYQFS